MMKTIIPCLIFSLCVYACFASIFDDPEIADGYLTNSEYVSMGVLEGYEKLIVKGGGQKPSRQEIMVTLKYKIPKNP